MGRLGGTRTWGVAGTLSSFGVSLGRLLRALPGALGSRGEQGRWEGVWEPGLCPEGEVEPLEDFEQRHDLEGASVQSLACRQINVSIFPVGGLVSFATSPRTETLQSPSFIFHSVGANIAGSGQGDRCRARKTRKGIKCNSGGRQAQG